LSLAARPKADSSTGARSYIGRRTTTSTLLLLPPAHFLALFLCSRLAALCAPRLRRHVETSGTGWVVDAGGASWSEAGPAALLAGAVVGEVLAVGQLPLEVACALQVRPSDSTTLQRRWADSRAAQTLLPPALLLASSRSDPPFSSSALSPTTVAACVAPLLLAISTFGAPCGAIPLVGGLAAVGARAGAWLVLAGGATSTTGAAPSLFQTLWSAAPVRDFSLLRALRTGADLAVLLQIATVLTSVVALANLAVRRSPSAALYPLPSMLLFVIAASLLHLVALSTSLAGLLSSAPHTDRDSLPKSALSTVPVALGVLVAARIGGVELRAFAASCAAAASGTVLVGWAARARLSDDADEEWLDPPRVRMSPSGARTPSPRSRSPPGVTRRAPTSRSMPFLAVVAFLPALVLLLQALLLNGAPLSLPTLPLGRLDPYYANRLGLFDHTSSPSSSSSSRGTFFSPPTLDVVFAYYDSPVPEFAAHVAETLGRGTVTKFRTRVSVYDKGAEGEEGAGGEERRRALEGIEGVDEVVQLENVGREGAFLRSLSLVYELPGRAETRRR